MQGGGEKRQNLNAVYDDIAESFIKRYQVCTLQVLLKYALVLMQVSHNEFLYR